MAYYPYIYEPETSPWGEVQHCTELAYGIYEVDTAGHGGVMVHRDVAAAALSPGARQRATMREGGFYCYEEDCDAAIPFRELLDRPEWKVPPNRTCSREDFEKTVDGSLLHWNADYVEYRKRRTGRDVQGPQVSLYDRQER